MLLQLLQHGDLIGDLAVLDGQPQGATVRAVWPSRLLQISGPDLAVCLARSPALCSALAVVMVERLRESNLRIQRLALDPVVERVYAQLNDWCETSADGERVVHEQVSRLELARLVGASREMVSRALRTLQRDGRLAQRGRRQLVLPPRPSVSV